MHIFVRDRHPENIYITKWRNGVKKWLNSFFPTYRIGVTSINSPDEYIAFRHCICSYDVNFLLSILTIINSQHVKLEVALKIYGQMHKTTDNVPFDY